MNDVDADQGSAEEEDREEPVVMKMKVVSHAVLYSPRDVDGYCVQSTRVARKKLDARCGKVANSVLSVSCRVSLTAITDS